MAAVAVAFAVGILVADYLSLAGCTLLVGSVLFVGFLVAPPRYRATLVLIALVAMSGAWRYAADRSVAPDDISLLAFHVSEFEGTVASDIGGAPDSARVTFRVDRVRLNQGWRAASGDVMVNLYANDTAKLPRLEYGDRARISVRPYVPYEPTNPGQFSWKGYLARHGIYTCASVRDPGKVVILRRSHAHSFVGAALVAKRYLVSAIRRIHPPKEASVMCGVVLGTYAYLDEDTLRDFSRTGTMHVLAASGYNCFILVLLASPFLRLVYVFPRYRGYVTVFLILIYLLMVGPVPSMMRAAVMSTLVLLALPLRRVPDYKNLFYVAAFVVLLFSPSNLFDIGFQLSFLAVWALISVAPIITALLERTSLPVPVMRARWNSRTGWASRMMRVASSRLSREMASVLVGTTAVSLVTAPVVAYYFHYVSLVALPANLAVALAVPVVFFDSFLSAVTSLIPHSAGFIGGIGTLVTRVMLWVVDGLGSMRYSAISTQAPGMLGIAGYYLLLYATAGYVRSRYASR